MSVVNIQNPEADPAAVALLKKVEESITFHWKMCLPALIKVSVSKQPLIKVPSLKTFWSLQDLPKKYQLGIQVVCPHFDDSEATLWVYFNRKTIMSAPEYYFKKEVYATLAELLWVSSEKIRDLVHLKAPYLATKDSDADRVAFRDTFSRFFLNPEWLQEKKPGAWTVISAIDKQLADSL